MTSFTGLPLVVCGTLKIAYDLALFCVPPHQAAGRAGTLERFKARDYQGGRRPSGRLHHPSLIPNMRPLRQLDLRRVGRVGLFRVKASFWWPALQSLAMREPVPFLSAAQRALTALGFQFT